MNHLEILIRYSFQILFLVVLCMVLYGNCKNSILGDALVYYVSRLEINLAYPDRRIPGWDYQIYFDVCK